MRAILFLSPCVLYAPQIIPGVETQAALPAIIAFCLIFFNKNFRYAQAYISAAIVTLFIVALKLIFDHDLNASLSATQLLAGPLFFLGAVASDGKPPTRRSLALLTVLLLAAALFEIFAPQGYASVASRILDRATVTDGHRGISLFTPEPTYAAISLVYFLLLAWWSRIGARNLHKWIEWVLVGLLVATLSTYAMLFFAVIILTLFPRVVILGMALLIAGLRIYVTEGLDNDASVRAIVAISRIISSDLANFLPSLSIIDPSLSSRIITNIAGFQTPFHSLLGFGLGCQSVPNAFLATGLDIAFSNPVLSEVMSLGCLKPQSYLAAVLLSLGAAAIVFLLALGFSFRYALSKRRITFLPIAISVAILLFVVQGQLTNPIPWLLLYIGLIQPTLHLKFKQANDIQAPPIKND